MKFFKLYKKKERNKTSDEDIDKIRVRLASASIQNFCTQIQNWFIFQKSNNQFFMEKWNTKYRAKPI